ncbi:MAG: hypothetical protein AB7V32_08195 [Candidatus Berkiella sp.]
MKLVSKILLVAGILFVSACSTSPKTQVIQMGDNHLSEQQILNELAKLDKTEQDINSKKGMTGTNVASFLLWWPGLAYTYYDASEAQKLIEQRRSHLTALYNQKHASNQQQHKPKAKG